LVNFEDIPDRFQTY